MLQRSEKEVRVDNRLRRHQASQPPFHETIGGLMRWANKLHGGRFDRLSVRT